MTTLREAAQQALEALEIGYDSAQAEAHQFHAAMAGYKPQHHAAMDADVQKIAAAITALRAALAEPIKAGMTRDDIIRMAREVSENLANRNYEDDLVEFFNMAYAAGAAAEREACAIAGGAAAMAGLDHLQVAAAIRARGDT